MKRLRRILSREALLLRAIWMLVTGRRDVKEDELALPYSSPLVPMLSVITVVDGLVAVGLHLLLPPGWIRTVVLILGILGLIWLLGFLASLVVYPHTLSADRLRLRFGVFHDILIPREAITDARSFKGDPGSTHSAACIEERLVMVVANQASLTLRLIGPTELTTLSLKLADQQVTEVIFYTDAPDDARQALSPRRPTFRSLDPRPE